MPITPWYIRILPYLLLASTILGGVWWIYDSGRDAERAENDARASRLENRLLIEVRDAESRAIIRENRRSMEDRATLATIAANTVAGDTRIIKEMTHEVRYTDPAVGYPAGVRDETNRSIADLACTPTDRGGLSCAVRKADPAPDP